MCPLAAHHEALGLVSPPKPDDVMTHLEHLVGTRPMPGGGNDSTHGQPIGSSWRFTGASPEDVFRSLFRYLDDAWPTLGDRHHANLRSLPLVPVHGVLARASQLFFRLPAKLAPLMHEVPRVYGAHDQLLRRIGVVEVPTPKHYIASLKTFATDCGGQALNVNELAAVVRMLTLLGNAPRDGRGKSEGEDAVVMVPDQRSVLVPSSSVLYNDAPWLASRLDATIVSVAHPRLGRRTCTAVGVRPLTQVVVEELAGTAPAPSTDPDAVLTQRCATDTVRDASFARAIAELVAIERQEAGAGADQGMDAKESESSAADAEGAAQALSASLRQRLDRYVLCCTVLCCAVLHTCMPTQSLLQPHFHLTCMVDHAGCKS